MLQDYFDEFVDSMEDFRIARTRENVPPFEEVLVKSVTDFLPYRNNFVDAVTFIADYMDTSEVHARLIGFLEDILPFQSRPESQHAFYKDSEDNYNFIMYELCLYLIATFIKRHRYATAALLIEHNYTIAKAPRGSDLFEAGIAAFNEPTELIDTNRNALRQTILSSRPAHRLIQFKDIVQVDWLLFIRRHFPNPEGATSWLPWCLGFLPPIGTLELFAKATSPTGFKPVSSLLHVGSLRELSQQVEAMFHDPHFVQYIQKSFVRGLNVGQVMNFEAIKAAS
jgi:hypothetical protein